MPQLAAAAAVTRAGVAATVIRRKQDDENDKDQKTVVPETTAEVHRCSSFPWGTESRRRSCLSALSLHPMNQTKFGS